MCQLTLAESFLPSRLPCPRAAEGRGGSTGGMKHQMYDNPLLANVLAPLSGELPKAEGEALAVYFAMNTASELGATRS